MTQALSNLPSFNTKYNHARNQAYSKEFAASMTYSEMNWRKRENLLYDIYGCLRQACQRLPFA